MAAPVEPPVALFQKPRDTVLGDPVEAAHIPLGLTPHVLNSVDMMTLFADEHVAVVSLSNPHQVQGQRVCCFTRSNIGDNEGNDQTRGGLKCEGRATPQQDVAHLQENAKRSSIFLREEK